MSLPEIVTLGCRLNLAESERIAALVGAGDDLIVVNSCAVTSEAARQSRRAVRQARLRRPEARVVVTGCASDIEPEQFAALAHAVVPNAAKLERNIWGSFGRAGENSRPALPANAPAHTRAFVPVQTGCNHACTFCVIPQGRGASRSRPAREVIETIADLVAAGVREVVLTGVDLTAWGEDLASDDAGRPPRLGELVAAILRACPDLPRLRLSSLDGIEIDPLLLELIASERRVMPHLHLSLQSGDDMVLKRMKRRHRQGEAVALIERLRTRRPEIAIGADLIAGFPTESEAMHANSVAAIDACDVVHGHIFPYSPRPGTPAARMPQVEPARVRERAAELRAKVAERRRHWLASLVGSRHEVLAERDGTGHAGNFARFRLPADVRAGAVVPLRAGGVEGDILVGAA